MRDLAILVGYGALVNEKGPQLWWKRWLLVTGVLWGAAVLQAGLTARSHALEGESLARTLTEVTTVEQLTNADLGLLRANAEQSVIEFRAAQHEFDRPLLFPVRVLPILGRQLESATALANSGASLAESLVPVLTTAEEVLGESADPDRLAQLRNIEAVLVRAEANARDLDLGPSSGLLGPLHEARLEFIEKQTSFVDTASTANVALAGMISFLDSSNYLLLVPNNAEMRLGIGMPLSIGEINVVDGDIQSPDLQPTNELYPVPYVPIVDDDITARWGFLSPANDYRKLGYSARFAEWSGPQAVSMWNTQQQAVVEGVVAIDPFVLGALLDVTGPVTIDGLTIDATTATDYLLIDQYIEYSDRAVEVQDERRERQSVLAGAIVARFGQSSWDPIDLLNVLKPLAEARHILVYSSDATEQEAWESLGVSGTLQGDEVGAYLLNLTASKTDPFVDVSVEYSDVVTDAGVEATLEITIANRTPSDVSDFTAGIWDSIGIERGDYLGRLAIYAPASATDVRFSPETPLEVFGPDGQVWVMATRVTIPRGATITRTATFTLPLTQTEMTVLPSARYGGTTWLIGGAPSVDNAPIMIAVGDG